MKKAVVGLGEREFGLEELAVPLQLDELLPGSGGWEVELGIGKGRYLLQQAQKLPTVRYLGVEMASTYYRLARRRARRRALRNVLLIRGEALFLLAAVLPQNFASIVHVYFPDPWPKARHHRRRLFDAETVDLVLGLLRPAGRLFFATDHLEYGNLVQETLESHPDTEVKPRSAMWDDGARTNYEAKYEQAGRPIMRLEVIWKPEATAVLLHPGGETGVLAATCPRADT